MMSRVILAGLFCLLAAPAFAAATIAVQIDDDTYPANAASAQVTAGVPVTIEIIIKNGKAAQPVQLPHADGTTLNGSGTNPQPNADIYSFFLTPNKPGAVIIKPFDVRTTDGQTLHVGAIRLRAGK
jgi:hypothetical protein